MGTNLNADAAFPSASNLYSLTPKDPARIQNLLNRLGDGNDTVHISKEGPDDFKVTINGHSENVSAEELQAMEFDLEDGDDLLKADEGVDVAITAKGGKGNDQLTGGKGNDKLDGGEDMDYVDGRDGNDNLSGITEDGEIMIGGKGKDMFNLRLGIGTWVDLNEKQDEMVARGATSNSSSNAREGTTTPTLSVSSTTPAAATPAVTTPAATTPVATPAAGTPGTAAPTSAAPAATPAVSNNNSGTSGITVTNGAGNVTINTAPVAAAASSEGVSGTPGSLASVMASAGSGLKKTGDHTWSATTSGMNFTVSQPGGTGTDVTAKWEFTSGTNKGMTVTATIDAKTGKTTDVDVEGGSLSASDRKSLEDLIKKGQLQGLDEVFSTTKKKKNGNSSTTGAGEGATASNGSTEGSSDSSLGGVGDSGQASGLNIDGDDMSGSWFLTLAIGMGTIMNTLAEKMVGLLNKIKAAGDDPPYKLTAEFQATSQQLSFMQQAFMAALNALGESIKTGVTAGGAAR
jgi:RTX calcium-binding nonapeptide repeat (4 copies)